MVLSKAEGIVISMIGLFDGIPFRASLYPKSISSMLKSNSNG